MSSTAKWISAPSNSGSMGEFVKMLPSYAESCHGEGNMHDTAMLFGALGWDDYRGKAEIATN